MSISAVLRPPARRTALTPTVKEEKGAFLQTTHDCVIVLIIPHTGKFLCVFK